MKKKPKRKTIIRIVAGFAVLALVIAGVTIVPFRMETAKMTPLETGKVIPGLYAVKDSFVNVYSRAHSGFGMLLDR